LSDNDWRGHIEAILQVKMNISYSDIKSMSDNDFAREWHKYKFYNDLETKAKINVENEIKKNG